jgi:hypothetical protein
LLNARRGRSETRWTFKLQPYGRPIRPRVASNFLAALKRAFSRLEFKEAYDLGYRGEVCRRF